jgi:hypothetical protein
MATNGEKDGMWKEEKKGTKAIESKKLTHKRGRSIWPRPPVGRVRVFESAGSTSKSFFDIE